MFFPYEVDAIPGLAGPAARARELGRVSALLYAIPAGVLVVSLRRVPRALLAALAGSLATVGVTMFWWFGLDVHLGAIAAAVVLVILVSTGLVAPRPALRVS